MIYLDSHATTPTDPRVLERMLPFFTENFGNPMSRDHIFGWKAEKALGAARREVATLTATGPESVIFTSGATESTWLGLRGWLESQPDPTRLRVATSVLEHKATLEMFKHFQRAGAQTHELPVDSTAQLRLEVLEEKLKNGLDLVSLIYGQNELGVLFHLKEIKALCARYSCLLHLDIAQSLGKVPVDLTDVHLASSSSHKLYGPKGIGALSIDRARVQIKPLWAGGGQEEGLRSGTLNMPAIVGFGAACALASEEMEHEIKAQRARAARLLNGLRQFTEVRLNGDSTERLPHNLHLTFLKLTPLRISEALMKVAYSSGSACSTGKAENPVLDAIGMPPEEQMRSLRFGLSRFTTDDEIDEIISDFGRAIS